MANHKSALKRIRSNEAKRLRKQGFQLEIEYGKARSCAVSRDLLMILKNLPTQTEGFFMVNCERFYFLTPEGTRLE